MTLYVILGTIGTSILIVGAVFMIWKALIGAQMLRVTIHDPSTNDDNFAVAKFANLLEQAKTKMVVYDDGNEMAGSAYMQRSLIEAVQQKLHDNSIFTMYCYFNYDEPDTLFRQTFDNEPRVDIRTGGHTPETRPSGIHYKIIDDGRMAYLSQHGHGDSERKFQLIDCTEVSEWALKSVTNSLLGEYKKDIKKKFAPSRLAS